MVRDDEMMQEARPLLNKLAGIPARISTAVAGWSDAALHQAPQGQWSAADILAHIRASDDIVAQRIYMILARDNPPLPAFDERRWAEVAGYREADFRASLAVYAARRAEVVNMLQRAGSAGWARTGVHETRGALSITDIVSALVEHEEEHCAQLEALSPD